MHLVSLGDVCKPKRCGGLGLRQARRVNQTCMMKAGWELATNTRDLWVKVVRAKYRFRMSTLPMIRRDIEGSNFWKGTCKYWPQVCDNSGWRVGNGIQTRFWDNI